MTREQQISDAAQKSDICGNRHDLDCFVAGAQWADSHQYASANVSDIIGKGKAFEPPFRVNIENNNLLIKYLITDSRGVPFCWGLATYSTAQHVCDLLNREHCEEGGEK